MLELAWGFSVMCSCPLEEDRMESDQLTMIPGTLVFHRRIWKPYEASDERYVLSYEEQNVSHPWRVLKARKVRGPKLSGLLYQKMCRVSIQHGVLQYYRSKQNSLVSSVWLASDGNYSQVNSPYYNPIISLSLHLSFLGCAWLGLMESYHLDAKQLS